MRVYIKECVVCTMGYYGGMVKPLLTRIVSKIKSTQVKQVWFNGKKHEVRLISTQELRDANLALLGYVYEDKIYVQENLPERVERAVVRHEVYHVNDSRVWLGRYGKEMRANAHTLLHDPVGFTSVFLYSLRGERLKAYWRLYVWPRNLN